MHGAFIPVGLAVIYLAMIATIVLLAIQLPKG